MSVKMKSGALDTKASDRWYVTDGANSVGPVKLDLLTRGVEAGRVPLDSFVRHEAWKVWRPLTDFTDFVEGPSNGPTSAGPVTVRAGGNVRASGAPTDTPLPQFPLSDRGSAGSPDSKASPESAKVPSLIEFAYAEGVPSRSSGSSLPPPPSRQASEATPSAPSWISEDEDAVLEREDALLDGEELDLSTDV